MTSVSTSLIGLFKAVTVWGFVLQSRVKCQVNSPSTEGPLIGPPPTGVQFFEPASNVYPSMEYSSPTQLPLHLVTLPPGFNISLYANQSVPNARSMVTSGASGQNVTIVYVSSQEKGVITGLVDHGSKGMADEVCVLIHGLDTPEGVVWHNGSLYVFETTQLIRFDNIDASVINGCKPIDPKSGTVVVGGFPRQRDHESRYMALGPDGQLYVGFGAPANLVKCQKYGAIETCSIMRMTLNGSSIVPFATGIRNTVGFDFQPGTNDLYFTFLERDWLGNNQPDDYLDYIPLNATGKNFNWPYCHWIGQGNPDLRSPGPGNPIPDDFMVAPAEETYLSNHGITNNSLTNWCQANTPPPVQALGPHVAALGVIFANGTNFPSHWSGNDTLFIAEHGSWNRNIAIGYRIALVQVYSTNEAVRHEVFASGWLQNENTPEQYFWGRPNHLLFLQDGSMLVSDDFASAVYRITYSG